MRRRGAAGADKDEVARVIAPFDRDAPDAVHHVVVDDGEHAIGRLFGRKAERIGYAHKRATRLLDAERQLAAEQSVRIEIAQHQIGIRRGGLDAALAIAGGAWISARRLRTDLQEAE